MGSIFIFVQMWLHLWRHRGQRCDNCAPSHFNLSCLSPSVRLSSARWPGLGHPCSCPARQHGAATVLDCACCAWSAFFDRHRPGTLDSYLGSGAGCRVSPGSQRGREAEAEASSRPGQRPQCIAADWPTLPHQSGAPQPLRPSVRWPSLKRRPDATVHSWVPWHRGRQATS